MRFVLIAIVLGRWPRGTPMPGGNVRQLWESAPGDQEQWSVQFDGLYERMK